MPSSPVKNINLLDCPDGTRFKIPKWMNLNEIRVFINGVESDDEEE